MTPASHFGSVQSTHLDCGISADNIHIRRHTKKPGQTGQIHGSSLNLKEQGINPSSGIRFLLFLRRFSPVSGFLSQSKDYYYCFEIYRLYVSPCSRDNLATPRPSCQESWDWLKQPSDFQCRKRAARRFSLQLSPALGDELFFFFLAHLTRPY